MGREAKVPEDREGVGREEKLKGKTVVKTSKLFLRKRTQISDERKHLHSVGDQGLCPQ